MRLLQFLFVFALVLIVPGLAFAADGGFSFGALVTALLSMVTPEAVAGVLVFILGAFGVKQWLQHRQVKLFLKHAAAYVADLAPTTANTWDDRLAAALAKVNELASEQGVKITPAMEASIKAQAPLAIQEAQAKRAAVVALDPSQAPKG